MPAQYMSEKPCLKNILRPVLLKVLIFVKTKYTHRKLWLRKMSFEIQSYLQWCSRIDCAHFL